MERLSINVKCIASSLQLQCMAPWDPEKKIDLRDIDVGHNNRQMSNEIRYAHAAKRCWDEPSLRRKPACACTWRYILVYSVSVYLLVCVMEYYVKATSAVMSLNKLKLFDDYKLFFVRFFFDRQVLAL